MKRWLKKIHSDNRGAALITVIVIVTFMSVLATIVLFASGKNFYMKTTDQANKESFYNGEKALEEIKASLMVESQKAFEAAYQKTMNSFVDTVDASTRQQNFNKEFVQQFKKNWDDYLATYHTNQAVLASRVDSTYSTCINCTTDNTYEETNGRVTVGTVEFDYTDANGSLTKIATEYVIQAPSLYWGGTPADPTDVKEEYTMIGTVNYKNWTKK